MGNKERVCAIVVTYNRKKLLIQCLKALEKQEMPLNAIYIVDNASTDGTSELLYRNGYINSIPVAAINEINIKKGQIFFHYYKINENMGGAGGFHEGLKRASKKNYDWFWLIDDDTIVSKNALGRLFSKIEVLDEKIGFLCSKVLWIDKNIHLMNIPNVKPIINDVPFNKYDDKSILLVKSASFVSLLLNKEIVAKSGFPLKEFFIWGDDVEYTNRITDDDYVGVYVSDSIVYHNTPDNYSTNILDDDVKNILKYSFGIRNNLYMIKKKGVILFFIYIIHNLIIGNYNILRFRKSDRLKFLVMNTKSSLSSIIFRPKE